jgi:hypothetical protein
MPGTELLARALAEYVQEGEWWAGLLSGTQEVAPIGARGYKRQRLEFDGDMGRAKFGPCLVRDWMVTGAFVVDNVAAHPDDAYIVEPFGPVVIRPGQFLVYELEVGGGAGD